MAEITNEMVYENIVEIKEKIDRIEHMLEEDFELSDEAKKELKKAIKKINRFSFVNNRSKFIRIENLN